MLKQNTRSSLQLVSKLSPKTLTDSGFFALLGKSWKSHTVPNNMLKNSKLCCCRWKSILQVIPSRFKNKCHQMIFTCCISVNLISTGEIDFCLTKEGQPPGHKVQMPRSCVFHTVSKFDMIRTLNNCRTS